MEEHSIEKEPSTEAEHLNHGEDKNFITAIQMINKDSDKMANHISLPIASVHTSKTGTDSAIVKGDQHMNCNSIHSHIIIEPTRSSISKRTGLSNEIDNSKETILTTSNQSNIEDPGAISNLPHSEEIIPNLPLAKKRCLSNCISSNSAIVINHSDLHDIQLCQDESENVTKPTDVNIIEENDNKVEHSNFDICNHFNEPENETPPNNSIPLAEIDNKDGLTSSHLGNTCESEQGSQPKNPESPVEIEDNDISHLFEVGKFSDESHTESQQNSSNSGKEFSGEHNNSDMRNNFMECTVHLLDVIIEEPGESLNASSDSLVSERSEPIPATKTERSVVKNEIVPKLTNQCKVPVHQFVPNIETDNKLDKCYSLEEEDISSDSSNNSMLRRLESDSDGETVERKYDSNVRVTGETQSLTYQEESCSTDLLHRSESLDNRCCETSFGTCDMESGARRYSNRRKCSRQPHDRKESLEQRLRRRFTISDEHKQEVAKRIIALVIKYSLFVFNFCSWVVASVAVGLGLWVLTDKGKIISDGSNFYLDPTIMIVIVGGITFVVAFLGCVGALRENLLLLKVFFIVLGVIVVIELIIAITIFIMYTVPAVRERFLRSTPENILRSAIERYMDDDDIKKWIDLIQQEFRCCGVGGMVEINEGYKDWQLNAYFNCTPSNKSIYRCAVPTSCCIFEKGDRVNTMCGFELSDKKVIEVRDYIYTRGCIHGFGEWLSKYDELIVIAALTTLIMQFLAVISAKIMIRRIVKRRQRWGRLRQASTTSTSSIH